MIVLCYLAPQMLAQVQRACPHPHRVSNVTAWDALVTDVRHMRGDVAVIDPCHGGDHATRSRLECLAGVSTDHAVVPIVGYLSVSAPAMHAVQSLTRLGAIEIVIRGVDDSTPALAATILRAYAACGTSRLVAAIRDALRALPPNVASAIATAFHHPERLHSVGDLATAAKTTRRSLDRWLARAGLAPARTLLACSRANAAYHLLSSGHVRRTTAASLLGYASSRSLGREMRAVTGYHASAVVSGVSRDAFVAALGHTLVRDSSEGSQLVASY